MKEERKRILDMLKSGEITTEEAEKMLDQLGEIETAKTAKEEKIATELSAVVKYKAEEDAFDEEKQTNNHQQTMTSTKEKLLEFVDKAMKKVKELDLDFYNSVIISHVFQQPFTEFRNVIIHIPYGSVQLNSWDGEDVRLECEAKVYREEEPTKGKERFLQEMEFAIREDTLVIQSHEKFMKVTAKLFVPAHHYDKISVKLFNGPIEVRGLHTSTLEMKTANGKIHLSESKGEKVEIETSNGGITLIEVNYDKADVETVNGRVEIDGRLQSLAVETISGSIFANVRNIDVKKLDIESATGSVYIKLPKGISLSGELKTNIGNLQMELDDISLVENKNEFVQKSLKFEPIGKSGEDGYVEAESKMGSVFVKHLPTA
ncbi:DUF4097 family beta strand repeat-containing protein [Bacillus kwashiorkori]|uniref:DUF4097 family beta strand repeat-containing protein n=1 Tax=Bacillus kwashiorkori TaxID=1522318 RepID=UPI0007843A5F|nr:DUF4097 domain-containing protein [Bacillus kwashiorkori]